MNELVDKKFQELNKQKSEAEVLAKIAEKYSDIRECSDRWQRKYYVSEMANPDMTNYSMCHSCGCCPDPVLYVYPYLEIDGVKIYAGPLAGYSKSPFCIGEREAWHYTDRSFDGWKEKMVAAKIPQHIIDSIQKHFDEQAEEYKKAAEDYDDDD